MNRYRVLVTGYAYVEVEAGNCNDAEEEAFKKVDPLAMRFDAVCDEEDLIKEIV